MPKDLDELAARKKELLFESDINRQILALESSQIKLKAIEWRRSLAKATTVYKWVAPLAGLGVGFFAARKQMKKSAQHRHNGHSRGKFSYLSMLAPLGATAVRQAINMWRRSRHSAQANGNGSSAE